ncbi:MAG: hypothetical protein CL896_07055 [Dehalococcoidia bacterium]|nr:hypothetical protein [Dehalococcoidia bacterium]
MTQNTIASDSDLQYLRNTGTGVVLDAETRLGINASTKTLLPIQRFGDAPHIAGPVTTVRFLPKRSSEKPLTSMYEIMQNSGAGSVIVVEGHGYSGHLFGGNMAHMGIQTGVEAVLLDSGYRDYQEILSYGLNLFSSKKETVYPAVGSLLISELDVPINFDGVQVRPGDIAIGDDDGVIFIPQESYTEVMANVRDMAQLEEEMERLIREKQPGHKIRELLATKKNRKV